MDSSDFSVVKRAADRAIFPVGLAMIAAAAVTATAAVLAVFWAWGSALPDWVFDAASLLPGPLVALVLLLIYLWGRKRIQRRVIATAGGDSGYELMAQAGRRGALRRYNLATAVLAVTLFVTCVFYVSYLGSMLYFEEEEDWDDTAPTTTQASRDDGFDRRVAPDTAPLAGGVRAQVQRVGNWASG